MERKEKIQLLKDLAAGRISISDLKPKKFLMRIGYGPTTEYLIDGQQVESNEFFGKFWPQMGDELTHFNVTYATAEK